MGSIAFLFPGQGSQYVGMGKALWERFEAARSVFRDADAALGWEVSHLCFEGNEEHLNLTARTQPAILTTSLAAWRVLRESPAGGANLMGRASFVAGHSLGEYTALVVGGALRFQDAVRLVELRGQFMQEAVPAGAGAMAAVLGLDPKQVEDICRSTRDTGEVSPANLNAPGQVVIAGHRAAVDRVSGLAIERGARKVIPLAVSVPSHCGLMEPACKRLQDALQSIELSNLTIPLVNNSEARILTEAREIRDSLVTQLRRPLLWEDTVRLMLKQGIDTFVEVGPGRVLSGLVKKIERKATVLNVEDVESLDKTVQALGT